MASVKAIDLSNLNLLNNTGTNNQGTPSNSKTLFFVEPLDGLPVDNKDLFIFADLTATKKARSILMLNDNSSPKIKSAVTNKSEINLIGYRKQQDGSTIMTTDWSNKPVLGKVTDLDPNNTQNTFEGFGLESIDINITAMNPPTVTIKFIDTRGGGLFDQETFNQNVAPINAFQNDNTPYNIFFEMPPPLFYLTLKGYYGNPVTLCLYMIKWDGTFNSETGNFEITANFLGYTFAFLQDIRIGHLIGASNTEKGQNKLKQVTAIPSEDGYTFPEIGLDDLALKFQRITVLREETQKNIKEFGKLRVINEQIKYLKMFRTHLGYFSPLTKNNIIYGAYLDQSILKANVEQLFFRDVGIISEQAENNYNNLGKVIENGLKKYKEFENGNQEYFIKDAEFTDSDLGGFKLKFNEITDTDVRPNIQETLNRVNVLVQENEPDANIREITLTDFSGKTQGNWPINSGFKILNLRSVRKNIDQKLLILEEAKKTEEKTIQTQFNKDVENILGFTPNIRNIIGILCNNIEMFLSLIYDVGKNAEENGNQRYSNLGSYNTDSPPTPTEDQIVYPFPKVVDGEYREVYLGSIPTIEESLFPEIGFINELCTGLVYSIKQVKDYQQSVQASKTIAKVDSFPINANDFDVNPYSGLDGLPMETDGSLNKTFAERIIERLFISKSVSNYSINGDTNLNKIANLEAVNLYETLTTQTYKDLFNNTDPNKLISIATSNNIITPISGSTKYKFNKDLFKEIQIDNNGSTSSGNRLWNKILNLKNSIAEEFKNNVDVKSFTSRKNSTQYVKRYFDTSTCYLNKTYLTLETFKDDAVKNSIKGTSTTLDSANLFESYSINKLRLIPGYFQVPITAISPTGNTSTIDLSKPITESSIYKNSDDYGKAYLILSSFNFNDEKVLFNEIDNDYTKIIRLPWFYLLWLGANSYRTYNATEILPFDSEFPVVSKSQYYYVSNKSGSGNAKNLLSFLFEDKFYEWVNSQEFYNLKINLEKLLNTQNLSFTDRKVLTDRVNEIIFKEYDLIVSDPDYTLRGDKNNEIDSTLLLQYLTTFTKKYNSIYKPNTAVKSTEESKVATNILDDNDIKSAFYVDLKHIYDNWIAGNPSDDTYSCCKKSINRTRKDGQRLKLFDLFKFVDKFRNPIAGDAIVNINSFNDLIGKKDMGMYSFISKILTDSYFMHFNLPIYIEYNNSDEVKSIFEPQTNFKKLVSAPNFLCVYNGPPSNTLNSNSNYTNDSFKINTKGGNPPALSGVDQGNESANKKESMVAFNVNYGSQSQSIFKNVTVSTQESKTTGEYITLLSEYVTGTGAAKPLIKDNSLFTLQRNRSYTATIQMLGNLMIQPQMYFQLNNIPFFSGSYMIMNVSHSLKPNNMNTTFKGVRQNPSPVKIVTEVTTFLNFQFDQGISSGFSFTQGIVLTSTTTNNSTPADLTGESINNYKPVVGRVILRSFTQSPIKHDGLDIEVSTINTPIQSVNKNGTVFYNLEGIDFDNQELPEPNYTFNILDLGTKWSIKIYNNNNILQTREEIKSFSRTEILNNLNYEAENNGFTDFSTGKKYPSYKEFRLTGLATYVTKPTKDTISKGVLIVKHDKEDDGYTYFTGYYGLVANKFKIGDNVSPKRNIGKPSKFKDNIGTTIVSGSANEKYYYHYEIRRTKEPQTITSYSDYLKLVPINVPNDIQTGILSFDLHDDRIYS